MSPTDHFQRGRSALAAGRIAEAADHFRAAIAEESELGSLRPRMKFRSYYGLSLALSGRQSRRAMELCRKAAEEDPFDAELQLNLARIYLLASKTTRALAAIERGLALDPENDRLRGLLAKSERRSRPLMPRLGRDHPLNRVAGRVRASLAGGKRPRRPASRRP